MLMGVSTMGCTVVCDPTEDIVPTDYTIAIRRRGHKDKKNVFRKTKKKKNIGAYVFSLND